MLNCLGTPFGPVLQFSAFLTVDSTKYCKSSCSFLQSWGIADTQLFLSTVKLRDTHALCLQVTMRKLVNVKTDCVFYTPLYEFAECYLVKPYQPAISDTNLCRKKWDQ